MDRSYDRESGARRPGISVSPQADPSWKKLPKTFSAGSREVPSFGKTPAERKVRGRRSKMGIDITWVTDRIGVGGGIWTAENMAAVSRAGVTHIIDMQIEFDDTALAAPYGIVVCWNPIDDDFQPKPPEVFARGVEFAGEALDEDGSKLFIHCAAGVHRAPMMALAILCSTGWQMGKALEVMENRRPVVDFAPVYVDSVRRYLGE